MTTYFVVKNVTHQDGLHSLPTPPEGYKWGWFNGGRTTITGENALVDTPIHIAAQDLLQAMKERENNKNAEYSGLVLLMDTEYSKGKNIDFYSLVSLQEDWNSSV